MGLGETFTVSDSARSSRGFLRRETFGFPQVYAVVHQGSANLRFSAVGIVWNSLDSLGDITLDIPTCIT